MFVGKTIDNYKMLEILGRGGMGIVYKALDTTLDNHVAVKMIDPNLASDESFMKRFRTEAKALAKLNDPNIVTVHALRETEYGLLLIMEYVEGITLFDWLNNSANTSIKNVLPVFKQILRALSHAHTVGIIHRDIKPRNILITNKNVVKITDFGLARLEHGADSTVTRIGGGTLRYMSPEQVKGLSNVTKQSDIYSVGMTLYEALAGRMPFQESDSEYTIIRTIVEKKFPAPTQFKANLPKKLNDIVMKAVEKKEEKRFRSADEMLDALDRFENEYHSSSKSTKKPDSSMKAGFTGTFRLFIYALIALTLSSFILFVIINEDKQAAPVLPTLSLNTVPENSSVYVNNEFAGKTPLNDYQINPGNHHVLVEMEDYFSFDTTLTIDGNSETKLNLPLLPSGLLDVTVSPLDAEIRLNGKKYDSDLLSDLQLPPGKYKINLSHKGYNAKVDLIQLRHGDRISKKYALDETLVSSIEVPRERSNIRKPKVTPPARRKPKTRVRDITISTEPSGADIFVNRKFKGKSPRTVRNLALGSYEIKITKKDYLEKNVKLTVLDKSASRFHYDLVSEKRVVINVVAIEPSGKPVYGTIIVDHKTTRRSAPVNIELNVGTHLIEVKKTGYSSKPQTVIANSDKKLVFVMKKLVN